MVSSSSDFAKLILLPEFGAEVLVEEDDVSPHILRKHLHQIAPISGHSVTNVYNVESQIERLVLPPRDVITEYIEEPLMKRCLRASLNGIFKFLAAISWLNCRNRCKNRKAPIHGILTYSSTCVQSKTEEEYPEMV